MIIDNNLLISICRFGHVFNAETGTSVGEILGQSKSLNSVDMRPSRPFKIVTASEDNTLAFFEGPPFKFKFTMNVRSCETHQPLLHTRCHRILSA